MSFGVGDALDLLDWKNDKSSPSTSRCAPARIRARRGSFLARDARSALSRAPSVAIAPRAASRLPGLQLLRLRPGGSGSSPRSSPPSASNATCCRAPASIPLLRGRHGPVLIRWRGAVPGAALERGLREGVSSSPSRTRPAETKPTRPPATSSTPSRAQSSEHARDGSSSTSTSRTTPRAPTTAHGPVRLHPPRVD